uniref:Uncharacterized protein n=1 Tax=Anguilla anguilla TaxID=7936 RepID=A0A0E9SMI7_ANGAN
MPSLPQRQRATISVRCFFGGGFFCRFFSFLISTLAFSPMGKKKNDTKKRKLK